MESQAGAETRQTTRFVTTVASLVRCRHGTRESLLNKNRTIQVEGEAQGDEDTLSKFLKDVDQGPRHAKVVQLTREDRDVIEGEASFSIRH